MPTLLMHFHLSIRNRRRTETIGKISVLARRRHRLRPDIDRERRLCAHRATWACVCVLGAHMSVTSEHRRSQSQTKNETAPITHIARGRREINGTVSKLLRFVETAGQTASRKMRAQVRSNLEPRRVLGTRAVSRARAHPDHLEHFRVYLSSHSR